MQEKNLCAKHINFINLLDWLIPPMIMMCCEVGQEFSSPLFFYIMKAFLLEKVGSILMSCCSSHFFFFLLFQIPMVQH